MRKSNLKLVATILVCGAFLFSSCIGSFALHGKLLDWNRNISSKFVNELVFLVVTLFRYMASAIWLMRWLSTPLSFGAVTIR